ncbi:hypothetical protein SSP35_04_02180 [Streptomyces sp. NBRC 110611]|nr:hypothetical protein SSP35_04_02180 [Streptomyces sp. NBRC 110611]
MRCRISTGTPPRSTGMVSGAPQAHGKVGGVKAFSRRHVGHRTGTLSAMVGSWRMAGDGQDGQAGDFPGVSAAAPIVSPKSAGGGRFAPSMRVLGEKSGESGAHAGALRRT